MHIEQKKKLTASLSVFSNIFLSLLKLVAGICSGSLSIISEAIHSFSDLFASLLTLFSVSKSSVPADSDHPYGHGKYEDMSGFIEGVLIIFASLFIIYEASKNIVVSEHGCKETSAGIIVMLIAVILNIIISSVLLNVAKKSNSISLYADGEHLRTDVYSSFGVFAGLILIKITGYYMLDSIIAILVAVFIYRTGYSIVKRAVNNLLDHSLDESDIQKIKEIINSFSSFAVLSENSLKARQVGPSVDIDLALKFPHDASICECHKICDEIEKQIMMNFPNASISIHSEPVCYIQDCNAKCKFNNISAC